MDGLKIWKIFGEKYVVVRTSSVMSDGASEVPYIYLGYFVDADDRFLYMAAVCDKDKICTAIELEAIEEISLYSEDPEVPREPAKILSLAPQAPTPSED